MFRHKENTTNDSEKKVEATASSPDLVSVNKISATESVKAEPGLKELIEKNLKWSQIIYEQNRKINSKLLWSAIANWLRLLLIAVPLIFAILFLPQLFKGFMSQYGGLLGSGDQQSEGAQENSLDSVLKLFNLDPAKQEQLKALLK